MSPVYKFSNAGGFTSKQRYTSMLAGNPFTPVTPPDTGAMFPLQVVTVGPAGASSVSFTNIPNTYSHLQIRFSARGNYGISGVYSVGIRYNSDSESNYSFHSLQGNGSSATAFALANQTYDYTSLVQGTNTTGLIFAHNILDILDYSNTNKFKTIRTLAGADTNGGGTITLTSASWRSTAAINSISFSTVGFGDFLEYSQFALYGIKGV